MKSTDALAQMVEVANGASQDALQRGFSIDQKAPPKLNAIKRALSRGGSRGKDSFDAGSLS